MFPNTHKLIYGIYGTSEWDETCIQDNKFTQILLPEEIHEKLHSQDGCLPLKTLPRESTRVLGAALKDFATSSPEDTINNLIKALSWLYACHPIGPDNADICRDNIKALSYQMEWLNRYAPHCLDHPVEQQLTLNAHHDSIN